MRILFLEQFGELGGGQRNLLDLLPAVADQGWHATVGAPGSGELLDRARALGAETVEIPVGIYGDGHKTASDVARLPADVMRLQRFVARAEADVISVGGARLLMAASLGARGRRVVFQAQHFLSDESFAGHRAVRMAGWAIRRAEMTVIANSEHVARQFRRFGDVRVVYNGVGEIPFVRAERTEEWRIGIIGRIAPMKGQTDFLRAAAILCGGAADQKSKMGTGAADQESKTGTGAADQESKTGTGAADQESKTGTGAADQESKTGTGAADQESKTGTGAADQESKTGTGAADQESKTGTGAADQESKTGTGAADQESKMGTDRSVHGVGSTGDELRTGGDRVVCPHFRFLICGSPVFSNPGYVSEVHRLAEGLPVEFLGWQDEVGAVLREMDLLLVPSTPAEATTRVILEAFSAGVPVVAYDVGGIPEIVRDGENGFLTRERSPESLAKRVREAMDGDLDGIAARARAEWGRRFTLKRYQDDMISVYRSEIKAMSAAGSRE